MFLDDGTYSNKLGAGYTVEKVMPSPFRLEVTADIYSSNTDQKLQILEQICMLFNPSLEIQTTDNYIDWTSLSVVELENINFSSRTIPVGTETEVDVATLTFSMPIFISPPTKVKKLGVITHIITSIFNEKTGNIDLSQSMPELMAYQDDYRKKQLKHPLEQVLMVVSIQVLHHVKIPLVFKEQQELSLIFTY